MIINLLHLNYELLFNLSLFYSIYIIYKKWKDLYIIIKFPIILNKHSNKWCREFLFFFTLIWIIIFFYFSSNIWYSIINISHNEYRIIKLTLGFLISILTLYITIKEKGFKSWRTLFSFFSMCLLLFYVSLLFDEEWKIFIYKKLNSYVAVCTIWIYIFISFFSYEYLSISGIDIINNLKIKLYKFTEWDSINKPHIMKIEDLLNKEDSINTKDIMITGNTSSKKVRIEDLLNKEDSNKNNQESKNKSINNSSIISKKRDSNILSVDNIKNDIDVRPSTSGSIGSASIMSHDSTISNAHISILQSTKQMVGTAELFTKQWNEGKILSEEAKDKKELIDKIIDLPDEKVFQLMNWRLKWEQENAMTKFIYKRNMPVVPKDQLIEMTNAAFNETMSNKGEKQKFWARMKSFVKEPTKDKNDLLDKLRKETLSLYIKGEEEAITVGEKKKKPLELGGRKFKKGGLIAIYEDKKIDAEATLQQQELKAMKRGIEVKRIIPSLGRLSIFEIMNQSVVSVIQDFKKLNLDSSTPDNINNEVKTDINKSQPNIKDNMLNKDNNVSVKKNNVDTGKSVLVKGDNNELNKKRRIN